MGARGLGAAAVAALALHLAIEGTRWMLVPAYGLALLYGVVAWRPPRTERRGLGWAGGVAAVLVLALSGAPAWLLPVLTFPAPDRPVGMTLVEMEGASGALPVRLFYPAAAGGATAPYGSEAEHAAFAAKYGLPAVATSHVRLARLPVGVGAPVADGPWPVLLFGHGYHVPPSFYGAFLPALAGRGYVVAVAFPGEATMAVFPDGRSVAFDQPRADSLYPGSLWERIGALNESWDEEATDAGRLSVFREINTVYPDFGMARRWAADLSAVLDALTEVDGVGAQVDPGRVEALGHSAGGGAAA